MSNMVCEFRAFAFFGSILRSILYDNTKLAVARILGDGARRRTRIFSELQSHLSAVAQNWSKVRLKTGPLDVVPSAVLRVVPVVHRRDARRWRA